MLELTLRINLSPICILIRDQFTISIRDPCVLVADLHPLLIYLCLLNQASIYIYFYLNIYQSIYLALIMFLSTDTTIYLSFYLFMANHGILYSVLVAFLQPLSIYLCILNQSSIYIYISIHLYIYQSIYLSI